MGKKETITQPNYEITKAPGHVVLDSRSGEDLSYAVRCLANCPDQSSAEVSIPTIYVDGIARIGRGVVSPLRDRYELHFIEHPNGTASITCDAKTKQPKGMGRPIGVEAGKIAIGLKEDTHSKTGTLPDGTYGDPETTECGYARVGIDIFPDRSARMYGQKGAGDTVICFGGVTESEVASFAAICVDSINGRAQKLRTSLR